MTCPSDAGPISPAAEARAITTLTSSLNVAWRVNVVGSGVTCGGVLQAARSAESRRKNLRFMRELVAGSWSLVAGGWSLGFSPWSFALGPLSLDLGISRSLRLGVGILGLRLSTIPDSLN